VLDRRGVENLARRARRGRVVLVGDVMVDVRLRDPAAGPRARAAGRRARGDFVLATAHRAGNVDDPAAARAGRPAARRPAPVVLPLHPRTRARLEAAGCSRASRRG
jgi:UDP-N-acetylglucosamine 2-epimerase